MKAREESVRGEDWELWRVSALMNSGEVGERPYDVSQNNSVGLCSRSGQYWECILYRYLAKVARPSPVSITGDRSCSELCNSTAKAWEAGCSLLSNCCQHEIKLLQSVELYGCEAGFLVWNLIPEGIRLKIIPWDQRKKSVLLLWEMSCSLANDSVLQSPVFCGAPHWVHIVMNSCVPF